MVSTVIIIEVALKGVKKSLMGGGWQAHDCIMGKLTSLSTQKQTGGCVLVLGYKLLKILVTLKAKPQGRGVEKFGKILVEYKKQTSTKGAKVDPPRSI